LLVGSELCIRARAAGDPGPPRAAGDPGTFEPSAESESESGSGSGAAASAAPRHAFVPKSRSSKVPTIPRIAAPRGPRRGRTDGHPRQPSDSEDEGA
ncbi:hypothetical protein ACE14D_11885, partial [Streptomyces sp. Act-28]